MPNNILRVAKNYEEILKADNEVKCQVCGEKQWSPFDKLFAETYEKCVDCTDATDVERLGVNIFKLLDKINE